MKQINFFKKIIRPLESASVFEVVWFKYRTEKSKFVIKQIEYYTAIQYFNYDEPFRNIE